MAATGKAALVDAAVAAGSKGGRSFSVDISKWVKMTNGNVGAVIRKIALDLGARVIMRTPVDTGRARANWMFSMGTPNLATTETKDVKTPVNSSGAGNSIAKTNLMTGLMNYNPANVSSVFLTNSLPYIPRLEYGWSKQAPNGMVRLAVAEFTGITQNAVKFVRTKGNENT